MKNEDIIYKTNIKTTSFAFIALALLIGLVALIKDYLLSTFFIIIFSLVLIYFLIEAINGRIKTIRLNSNERYIIFEVHRLLNKKEKIFNLLNATITFQKEIGAKGVTRHSFKIYEKGSKTIEIVPGISGWSNKTLENIYKKAEEIKRKN